MVIRVEIYLDEGVSVSSNIKVSKGEVEVLKSVIEDWSEKREDGSEVDWKEVDVE